MNTTTLMTDVPAETLLGLGILFGTAAIVLLALSTEAGNYPELRRWLQTAGRLVARRRPRHRCYLNLGRGCRRPTELAIHNWRT